MEEHMPITPLQHLQTHRHLCAKQWLTDIRWLISEVA
jgi:hypothetical protein